MPQVECPPRAELEHLFLGGSAEQEVLALEEHLLRCDSCLETLKTLLGTREPLEGLLHGRAPADPYHESPVVAALLQTLQAMRRRQATSPGGTDPGTAGDIDRADDRTVPPGLPPAADAGDPTLVPSRPGDTGPPPDTAGDGTAAEAAAGADLESFLALAQAHGTLGKYRIIRVLGRGGMGVVFQAEDPRLRRTVALKAMLPALAASAHAGERFLREAQAMAKVKHDHIVTIYQVDEDRDIPFLAMELLAGESLEERLQRGPRLPIAGVLRIGREIAEALAAAHATGLIHRDIKPSNIWLEAPRDRVKILDFGLARAAAPDAEETATPSEEKAAAAPAGADAGLTQRGAIIGTPAYMAPEQARGAPVDGRADLFSLGCVLYRLCSGQPPFRGTDVISTLLAVAAEEPPPLARLNAAVPPALAALVAQLLAKQPEDRPASAAAVVARLRQIEEARRPRPSRWPWWLAGAAAVLAAAALTAGVLHFAAPAPEPEEPGTVTFTFEAPDQRLGLRRGDEEERIVDVHDHPVQTLPAGDYALRPVATVAPRRLYPDRVLVKAGQAQALRLHLVGEARSHRAHGLPVRGVAVAALKDGPLVLSVGDDRTLAVWRPSRDGKPATVWHRESPLRCVAVSADGRLAATGSGDVGPRAVQVVRLWDLETLQPKGEPLACRSQVNAVAFAPNGKWLASAENDGTLALWDVRAGAVEWEEARTHEALGVFALAYAPDGKRLLSGGGDGRLVLRIAADGSPIRALEGHTKAVRAVAFVPGGAGAISAGLDGTIRVWDLAAGKARVWMAPAPVHALAVSGDGRRLVTGDAAGAVRLWDAASGEEIIYLAGNDQGINALAWAADGTSVVSGGSDGVVRLWDLPHPAGRK